MARIPTDPHPAFQQYANPGMLVSTAWLADHLGDEGLVVVESDEDVLLYETGHIPGAVKIDWHTDLQDPLSRDYLDGAGFSELMARSGISRDTTVVFYGDNFNWWAAYALWVFRLFGHEDVRLLNGGRQLWTEEGRDLSRETPDRPRTEYPIVERSDSAVRAFRDEVETHFRSGRPLVDVRSPEEYTGELLHMPNYPQEGALRGGHIPTAKNVPWKRAARDDHTFKDRNELEAIYEAEIGLSKADEVIAYCRIGERSSHTWFVLTYLLGYDKVRNYDGSWTEWGNLVRAPSNGREVKVAVEAAYTGPVSLPASSLRVINAARELGFDMVPTVFPEGTRTAAAAAAAIGCDVAQIVKSLVFMVDGSPLMVLMPGDRKVDLRKLAATAGGEDVRRATLDEVRDATGYAAGGTPPLGHVRPLVVLADATLRSNDEVWAAAGTPTTVFPITSRRLVDLSGARWVDVAEGSFHDE